MPTKDDAENAPRHHSSQHDAKGSFPTAQTGQAPARHTVQTSAKPDMDPPLKAAAISPAAAEAEKESGPLSDSVKQELQAGKKAVEASKKSMEDREAARAKETK